MLELYAPYSRLERQLPEGGMMTSIDQPCLAVASRRPINFRSVAQILKVFKHHVHQNHTRHKVSNVIFHNQYPKETGFMNVYLVGA